MDPTSTLPRWRALLHPLNLAALFTWIAVAGALGYGPAALLGWRWACALLFLAAFLAEQLVRQQPSRRIAVVQVVLVAVMAASALALVALQPMAGVAPALLVILVASIAASWGPPTTIAAVALINVALYLLLLRGGHSQAGLVVLVFAGFQLFALLTTGYARSAEHSRDRLARTNAELLATRALLADSTRDAERLRLSRELHDVAGHKLTALRLHLRALAANEHAAPELAVCERLSAELLHDIRAVVHALRDENGGGLDIATALQALAAPFPRPRLQLQIGDDVRITDAATAQTVLRCAQEALTNAARHGHAQQLHVRLSRVGDALQLQLDDDGQLHGQLQEGGGLTGMRERIAERGGRVAFSRGERGGLRIDAELPA